MFFFANHQLLNVAWCNDVSHCYASINNQCWFLMTFDLANNNVACSPHTFLCKYQIKTFSDIKLYLFSSQYLTEVSLQIIFNISFGPHSTLPSTGFILLCEISNIWKITFYTPCYNDVVE